MKKKPTPYLDFYKKCMKTGRIPQVEKYYGGLCFIFNRLHGEKDKLFELLKPNVDTGYWGYNGKKLYEGQDGISVNDLFYEFTPLRQTIVLFMAAMNNEL